MEVIYEDNHLLVVNKPAGLATMGVGEQEPSLWRSAKQYLKAKYSKPGNVYLGVVSRIDTPVTGVVVFARTSKAAARLSEQFREGTVQKRYWAIVERPPAPPQGRCEDRLVRADRQRKVHVVDEDDDADDARPAALEYRTLRRLPGGPTLLEIRLLTGRKHQIRVQLASRGWPILGDKKYGARSTFPGGIALHARQLTIDHPVRHEPLELVAPPPSSWSSAGVEA